MAANIVVRKGVAGSVAAGKRLAPVFTARKSVHSGYEKNPDHDADARPAPGSPAILPDNVIPQESGDKYWAPHPKTGVFGPVDKVAEEVVAGGTEEDSVLEQPAWFRAASDVHAEKEQHDVDQPRSATN